MTFPIKRSLGEGLEPIRKVFYRYIITSYREGKDDYTDYPDWEWFATKRDMDD